MLAFVLTVLSAIPTIIADGRLVVETALDVYHWIAAQYHQGDHRRSTIALVAQAAYAAGVAAAADLGVPGGVVALAEAEVTKALAASGIESVTPDERRVISDLIALLDHLHAPTFLRQLFDRLRPLTEK